MKIRRPRIATWIIEERIGEEYFLRFRESFKEIILMEFGDFDRWTPDQKEIRYRAMEEGRKARTRKFNVSVFLVSTIVFALSLIPHFTGINAPLYPLIALHGVSILLSALAFMAMAVLRVTAYTERDRLYRYEDKKFAYAWNYALNGYTPIGLIPIAIAGKYFESSYVIAMWFISDLIE